MQADDPLVRGRRRSVLVRASVAVLVLLVVAGALTWVQVSQTLGARAWREGDALTAAHRFAAGSRLNLVERWKAPFNRGVAAYSLKAWAEAAAWFETAVDRAPEGARCRVALNWAWTLEALRRSRRRRRAVAECPGGAGEGHELRRGCLATTERALPRQHRRPTGPRRSRRRLLRA